MKTKTTPYTAATKQELENYLIKSEQRIKAQIEEAEKCLNFIKQEKALNNINNCIECCKLLLNTIIDLRTKFLANQSAQSELEFFKLSENNIKSNSTLADV